MRVVLPVTGSWRHDLTHCLHTTMGVLVGYHGLDPLQVLGSGWGFGYRPGDVRREEYYFPCERGSLLASLAPHHRVSSTWHQPRDAAQGWAQVREAVAGGQPVAVAADNFYLPFRPAYRDVHTNHLLTVYGFDDEDGTVFVCDPVPPRFQGAIGIDELTAARDSTNPIVHDRDLFFTANPTANRWLTISLGPEQPRHDEAFVRTAVRSNVEGLRAGTAGPVLTGLAGQRRFLTEWLARLPEGDRQVDEVFILAGAILAITGLHADFLRDAGRRFHDPELIEIGRDVDRVAHHWAALRIAVAGARGAAGAALPGLRIRAQRLMADQEHVVARMSRLPVPALG
jgi:hypothetical protein